MKNLFIITLLILTLSSCADTASYQILSGHTSVGFWYGLWHGMIAPFAWIVSLFSDSVAIYAVYNNGGWYDFGFILGIGALSNSSRVK